MIISLICGAFAIPFLIYPINTVRQRTGIFCKVTKLNLKQFLGWDALQSTTQPACR